MRGSEPRLCSCVRLHRKGNEVTASCKDGIEEGEGTRSENAASEIKSLP